MFREGKLEFKTKTTPDNRVLYGCFLKYIYSGTANSLPITDIRLIIGLDLFSLRGKNGLLHSAFLQAHQTGSKSIETKNGLCLQPT